jgi:hypothetical protein
MIRCRNCRRSYKLTRTFNRHACVVSLETFPVDDNFSTKPLLDKLPFLPPALRQEIFSVLALYDIMSLYEAGLTRDFLDPEWNAFWIIYMRTHDECRGLTDILTPHKTYRLYRHASTEYPLPPFGLALVYMTNHQCFRCGQGFVYYPADDQVCACDQCRRALLVEKLAEKSLALRTDSKLCSGFIHNQIDLTFSSRWMESTQNNGLLSESTQNDPAQESDSTQIFPQCVKSTISRISDPLTFVVNVCIEMHWLFAYTPYKKRLDKAIATARDRLYFDRRSLRDTSDSDSESSDDSYEYMPSSAQIHRDVEPAIRRDVLREFPMPERLPWMKNQTGA